MLAGCGVEREARRTRGWCWERGGHGREEGSGRARRGCGARWPDRAKFGPSLCTRRLVRALEQMGRGEPEVARNGRAELSCVCARLEIQRGEAILSHTTRSASASASAHVLLSTTSRPRPSFTTLHDLARLRFPLFLSSARTPPPHPRDDSDPPTRPFQVRPPVVLPSSRSPRVPAQIQTLSHSPDLLYKVSLVRRLPSPFHSSSSTLDMDSWRVAVLGDGGVGKTALAVQACLLRAVLVVRVLTRCPAVYSELLRWYALTSSVPCHFSDRRWRACFPTNRGA